MTSTTAVPPGNLLADSQVQPLGFGEYAGSIPEAWRMFHAFGGMTFAVALRAAEMELAEPEFTPLSASAFFMTAVPCGPVKLKVRLLRKGKSTALATVELRVADAEAPALSIQALFGRRKTSPLRIDKLTFPADLAPRAQCKPPAAGPVDSMPIVQQQQWLQQDTVRGEGRTLAWVRYHLPPRLADGRIDPVTQTLHADILAVAILDGLPPGSDLFNLLTLHMEIEFFGQTEHDWTIQVVRALRVEDGYAYGSVELWDENRVLLARASQRAMIMAFLT